MIDAEPTKRASEIEEFSNLHIIHPLASHFTAIFAKLSWTPNAVSFLGMFCGALAGVAYYHYDKPWFALAGLLLMLAWHVMDGADGQLARLQNSQSESGKIIDGICDYVTFISVYLAFALRLAPAIGAWVWPVIVLAGICHAVQAAAYETQRQMYNVWGLDRKSAELPKLDTLRKRRIGRSLFGKFQSIVYSIYVQVQYLVAGSAIRFRSSFERVLAQEPAKVLRVRERYRNSFAPSIRRWAVFSSNYRTVGIFACALAGAPLVYFLFELIGFNLLLIAMTAIQARRYERFVATLDAGEA